MIFLFTPNLGNRQHAKDFATPTSDLPDDLESRAVLQPPTGKPRVKFFGRNTLVTSCSDSIQVQDFVRKGDIHLRFALDTNLPFGALQTKASSLISLRAEFQPYCRFTHAGDNRS